MAARRDRAQTGNRFWLSSGLAGRHRTRRRRDALHSGPVSDEVGFHNCAMGGEGVLQVVFRDFEVEVPDE